MSGLLNIRDAVRDFFRKYDEIISPVFRFVVIYIMFSYINKLYGYDPLFDMSVMTVLLSLICALVSDKVTVLITALVLIMNVLAVSKELALLFLVIMLFMYCTYVRLFPDSAWILLLVPVLYSMNLVYAVPMIVMMFAGMTGIVPIAFGGAIYFMSQYVREIADIIKTLPKNNDFRAYEYMIDAFKDNKEFMVQIIVFAAAIIIGNIFYCLSIKYSWYIGIGVCALASIIFFMICGSKLGVDVNGGEVFLGTFLGLIIALCVQVMKNVVDYSRKETVQFEDDEYYYYVQAIPKYNKKTDKIQKTDDTSNVAQRVKKTMSEGDIQ